MAKMNAKNRETLELNVIGYMVLTIPSEELTVETIETVLCEILDYFKAQPISK